ncbi:hypothetical protein F5Y01DRAFT_159550 [Xylaria sp. FL0043]|nr:hypothetical protein F5Y01DRAFT_159550 [Xylaria sp. FL0043]
MALGSDENPNNGAQEPFAYVLIPVLVFGLIVSLITCYRFRRRKRRLARLVEEGGSPTFVRDPETGRTRIDGRGANGAAATGRRRAGRRLGLGVGSREEGLNELGEAPPAYTPNAPKPPSVEHVELMTYSQATAEIGTSRSPPTYGEETSSGVVNGPAVGSTSGGAGAGAGAGETARLSEEMRRDAPGRSGTNSASNTTRLSEEMRRDATGNVTTTGGANENARLSQDVRGDATGGDDAAAGGAVEHTSPVEETRRGATAETATADTARLSEERRKDTPRGPTMSGDTSETVGESQETRRDTTEHTTATTTTTTTTTTEATTAADTTIATSSITEPAPPPKAVLPLASD